MTKPRVLTRDESRLVDRIAIDQLGIPGTVLMENAGRGVVDVLLRIDPALAESGAGAILCGKGNNAGDGFVIARHLAVRGVKAITILLCPPVDLSGDARANYEILARAGARLIDLSAIARDDLPSLTAALNQHASAANWLVDALLGTGATGAPREPLRTVIRWTNAQSARRLAVDVPSGLDCDTGLAPGEVVRADATCTVVAAKPGLLVPAAPVCVGEMHVLDIGVPPEWVLKVGRTE